MSIDYLEDLERAVNNGREMYVCPGAQSSEWEISSDAEALEKKAQRTANALKFQVIGSTPEIKISSVKKEGEWLFSVEDNGIGIDKMYHDKVFIIFRQLNSKSKFNGTGIVLARVKKIVERHGGSIWFESEPGKGTIFYFTIKNKNE